LRKPEGVAKPGEVSPVLVAALCFMRWKARDLMEEPHKKLVASSASA
jgi:hypothetical protein